MSGSAEETLNELARDIELARLLMKRKALIDHNGSIHIGKRAEELAALAPGYHAYWICISPDGRSLGLVRPHAPLALVSA